MFAPDETPGRRKNWGVVYGLLGLMGMFVLIPQFTPQSLDIPYWVTLIWGLGMLLGFGTASVSSFVDKRFMWLENASSWLGNAGLSVYVVTLVQSVLVGGALGKTPQTLGFVALLVIMVSRSYRLQKQLKTVRRLKEIVRIAHRNDME